MRRAGAIAALAAVASVVATPTLGAQRAGAPPQLSCSPGGAAHDSVGRRAMPGGAVVTLARVGESEGGCAATVTVAGKRVFREEAFGARVDAASGMDIDGDGIPDVVLEIDTGGGQHCCWKLVVVTPRPPARVLFQFERQGAATFRGDAAGVVTLESWEGGFFGPDASMAGRIFAARVYAIRNGGLADVTPSHCDALLAKTPFPFSPADSSRLRSLAAARTVTDSVWDIAGEVQARMLQLVFCRRFDDARRLGDTTWPAEDRKRMLAAFAREVATLYKEYAAPLAAWR